MSMTLIVAGGLIAFLLVYFGASIDKKEHFALQLLAYSFAMILIILVAKGAVDATEKCELVPNVTQEVYVYGNNFDGYHWDGYNTTAPAQIDRDAFLFHKNETVTYSTVCYEVTPSTSAVTLYRFVLGFFILYLAYLIIYTFYWIIKRFADRVQKR